MPVTVNKIDTSVVAETLRQQIREDVAIVPGARPRLVGFLANKDPAARKYAEWTGRACTKDGIDYVLKEVEACDLEGALKEANEDAGVSCTLSNHALFILRVLLSCRDRQKNTRSPRKSPQARSSRSPSHQST